MDRRLALRLWLNRRKALTEPAAAAATWHRAAMRTGRNVVAALGAGVVIGAIGWEFLEQKTRSYWT